MTTRIPYVFLCGYPKSGTTLLMSLLDSHPQLNVFPEELKYATKVMKCRSLSSKRRCMLNRTGAAAPTAGRLDYPSGVRDYSDIPSALYLRSLRARLRCAKNDRDLLDAVFETWAEYSSVVSPDSVEYYVEKTPRNELYIPAIKQAFDGARFIYVVRDPRDNYLSYKRKKPNLTVDCFIQVWRRSVESILGEAKDSCMIMKYEDYVQSPKSVMRRVCRFLDIAYVESMLMPTRNGVAWGGNSMFSDNSHQIHVKAVGRHLDMLDENISRQIASALRDHMSTLGYAGVNIK